MEIHNSPTETIKLVQLLSHLEGVDLVTAQHPDQANHFIVRNSKGEQAEIEWIAEKNSFKYRTETGDPLDYGRVLKALAHKGAFDASGFATDDAWMAETLIHRYPVALERIVRAHTKVARNPASILLSLDKAYVHSGWLLKMGIDFAKSRGTHGALDDISSTGVLLSSFAPTKDTSSSRVAGLFDGFKGRRDYRSEDNGAEWVWRKTAGLQAMVEGQEKPGGVWKDELFLRVWTPAFARLDPEVPINITMEKAGFGLPERIRRSDPEPVKASLALHRSPSVLAGFSGDRSYAIPAGLRLQPKTNYRISIRIGEGNRRKQIFKFTFWTDSRGKPIGPAVESETPKPSKMTAEVLKSDPPRDDSFAAGNLPAQHPRTELEYDPASRPAGRKNSQPDPATLSGNICGCIPRPYAW